MPVARSRRQRGQHGTPLPHGRLISQIGLDPVAADGLQQGDQQAEHGQAFQRSRRRPAQRTMPQLSRALTDPQHIHAVMRVMVFLQPSPAVEQSGRIGGAAQHVQRRIVRHGMNALPDLDDKSRPCNPAGMRQQPALEIERHLRRATGRGAHLQIGWRGDTGRCHLAQDQSDESRAGVIAHADDCA